MVNLDLDAEGRILGLWCSTCQSQLSSKLSRF
jgi:hypothetical protein